MRSGCCFEGRWAWAWAWGWGWAGQHGSGGLGLLPAGEALGTHPLEGRREGGPSAVHWGPGRGLPGAGLEALPC